jgi:hypothetical protein
MFVILMISLLILSHVLTDFYLLSDKLEEKKKDNLSIFKHSVLFLLCSLTLTIAFFSFYLWFVIFVISILYFIVKKLKIVMSHEERFIRTFIVFVSEHLTHVIVIFAAYPFLKHIEPNEYMNILISKLLYFYPFLDMLNNIKLLSYIALVIAGFLFSIRGGTRLSLIIINLPKEYKKGSIIKDNGISETILIGEQEVAAAKEKDNNEKEISKFSDQERMKRYGKMIGIIERIIIITAILLSQYQIVVIMTAIKSIGRFKEITEKTSDYYIIGNFASFSIAFFVGFILLAANRFLLR